MLGFEHRSDAERFLEELGERLVKFGLELHPDKTRRIEFGRRAIAERRGRGEGKPETFDFLGFTHICENVGKSGGKERALCGSAQDRAEADASEAGGNQKPVAGADARAASRDRQVAADGGARLLSIPRGTGKPADAGRFSLGAGPALATDASASRPETPDELEPVYPAAGRISAAATMPSPVSQCAFCR